MARLKRLAEPTEIDRMKDERSFSPKTVSKYLYDLLRSLRLNFDAINYELSLETYEDLRFPATSVNPPGSASDPDWDMTNGGWLFNAASTEVVYIIAQLPHSWAEGTEIEPHVHWQKTTSASGDVLWRFEYKWAPTNDVMDTSFTTLNVSSTVDGTPDTGTADKHLVSSLGWIDSSNKQISDMLIMKLSRVGGDALDTYGDDARLLEFDIHYKVNSRGSLFPYVKD